MSVITSFYGSYVATGFNKSNVFSIRMAEFKPTDWFPVSRFNDENSTYIQVNGSQLGIKFDDVSESARVTDPTNIIANPRTNIVHKDPNTIDTYTSDGCYIQWLYAELGDDYYNLSLYAQDLNMYTIDFETVLPTLTRGKVTAIYFLAYDNGNNNYTIRPMIQVEGIRYIIGPLLPSGLVSHWGVKKEDTERPSTPTGREPTDDYNADGWDNSFEIMRGGPYVENFRLLKDMNTIEDVNTYWDNLGGDSNLHFFGGILDDTTGYLGHSAGTLDYLNAVSTAYTMTPATLGSSLYRYRQSGDNKNFVKGSTRLDGIGAYDNLPTSNNEIIINRDDNSFSLKWTKQTTDDRAVLSKIHINTNINGNNYSYTYNGNMGKDDVGGGEYYSIGVWVYDVWIFCIPKSNTIPPEISGFYLVGWTNVGVPGNNVKGNFVAIDKLDILHLDEIFDDWSQGETTESEKFTENLVKDELGGELGTGELVDVENLDETPNTHDGTMGNGTGSVHEGDTKITDPVDFLPVAGGEGSVLGSGFIKVYTPKKTQLDTFTSELLSDDVIDVIKDYFTTNPMEGVIGLSMLPYSGFSSSITGKPKIGTYKFDSELDIAGTEYLQVDYGTIDVKFSYDGYENYSQYSDCKIFLPHIGYKELDIDMIQGCRLNLKYIVSLVTGDIYAYLYAKWVSGKDKGANNIDHLLYHWQGNCTMSVPVTHIDKSSYVNGAIQAAGNIASIVSGGLTMNSLAGQMNMAESSGEYAALNKQFEGAGLSVGRNIAGLGSSVASMFKPSITTSGNISGACAYMSERVPYLLMSRPIIIGTDDIKRHYGLVTAKKYSITDIKGTGYTELNGVDLNGVTATEDELNELKSILEGGFYA